MEHEELPDKIKALLRPDAFDHKAEDVHLIQTHISYVVIAGDFVYKFKKPVNFGFLDFSTLDKRKFFCETEVLLNRRLCPDIYLNTVTLTREKDRYVLNGHGDIVEYGVKMVRMPEERMMVNLIREKRLEISHINEIVNVLATFYKNAEQNKEIEHFGTLGRVAANVCANFEQTRKFAGGTVLPWSQFDHISHFALDFLKQKELFVERISQGRIRDCHGDLYSANICLADKVYIFDCIEFNHRFRYCDIASDAAFLAMDLDFHGLGDFSDHFVNRLEEMTGDFSMTVMLNFYKCYRAYVRGKIGLFTANDPEIDNDVQEKCLADAARYFALAEKYASS